MYYPGFLRRYDVVAHPELDSFLTETVRAISAQIYTAGGDLSEAFRAFDSDGSVNFRPRAFQLATQLCCML